jgi:hypothetical protein
MRVTVDGTEYTLVESGRDRWEVFGKGRGVALGEVWKGTRTYSPPAAGFGGRIVRFHKKVQCWKSSISHRNSFETRKDAIRGLVQQRSLMPRNPYNRKDGP